jgi:hypothetical protein
MTHYHRPFASSRGVVTVFREKLARTMELKRASMAKEQRVNSEFPTVILLSYLEE